MNTLVPATHPKAVPVRPVVTTFCDHCQRLVKCEQVRTPFGIAWLCDDARGDRKPVPLETLSSTQVEALAAFEALAEPEPELETDPSDTYNPDDFPPLEDDPDEH